MRFPRIGTLLVFLSISSTAAAGAPAAGAAPDSVLAEVGTRRITAHEFTRQCVKLASSFPAEMTPDERKRKFLDELVNKEALSLAANESFVPTEEESALLGLTRLMSMRAAYYQDVVIEPALKAGGNSGPHTAHADPQFMERQLANERALIDRLVDPMHPVFDDSTLVFLARAFERLPKPREQGAGWMRVNMNRWLPPVHISDTSRVLARSSAGPFTIGRFLWHWAQVPPDQRDRPDTAPQVREWVRSFLAQAPIDENARTLGYGSSPGVEAEVARRRELMAVERYYQTHIIAAIDPDSATLQAVWARDPERYHGMARHEAYAVWYETRAEAERALAAMRVGASWDSLVDARFPKPEGDLAPGFGTEAEMYREPQSLMPYSPDSTLRQIFVASKPGELIGPREKTGQWWVYRYLGFRDGRRNTFEQARPFVKEQWVAEEGERRLREHLRELRERYGVRLHEPAIAALALPDPAVMGNAMPPAAPGPGPARPHGHSGR